jgi:hypothetical protein
MEHLCRLEAVEIVGLREVTICGVLLRSLENTVLRHNYMPVLIVSKHKPSTRRWVSLRCSARLSLTFLLDLKSTIVLLRLDLMILLYRAMGTLSECLVNTINIDTPFLSTDTTKSLLPDVEDKTCCHFKT